MSFPSRSRFFAPLRRSSRAWGASLALAGLIRLPAAPPSLQLQPAPPPAESTSLRRVFQVDGQPFFPIGGQFHNSSAYDAASMERGWKALEVIRANFAEIPVYWEQLEPVEGQFDFRAVDAILAGARQRDLKVVLLWFATWKNGMMSFAPRWVKADPARFPRVTGPDGAPMSTLSPRGERTRDADAAAFARLLQYLRDHDSTQRTVIAVQVENEPGIIGSDRDYGAVSDAAFRAAVPADVVQRVADAAGSHLHAVWQEHGAKREGTWPELFGHEAGEQFTARDIARYIDAVAARGRAVYDLPLFTNAWLNGGNYELAGYSYLAGGPTANTLDMWKWHTPHLEFIAPDIYKQGHTLFRSVCDAYARPDNPLFVPESGRTLANALNLFYAIAHYHAVGYAIFGVDSIVDEKLQPQADAARIIQALHAVRAAIPLILRYQGTGAIHAVVQEEFMRDLPLELGEYRVIAHFGEQERGSGLVFQAGPKEFYAVGSGFRLTFLKKQDPRLMLAVHRADPFRAERSTLYHDLEEGGFNAQGEWVPTRRRNGDQSDHGAPVTAAAGVVRIVLVD